MASGSILGTTSNSSITARILWESKANASANTSDVTVTLQVKKSTATTSTTSGTGAWTVLINGVTYNFSAKISIPPNNTYVTVYTKTVTGIPHNVDGYQKIVLGWVGGIPGTTYTTTSIPDTVVDLDYINRVSDISSFSFTNGYIDQGIDITISPKVSGAYHAIHLYFKDTTSGIGIDLTQSGRKAGGTHHFNFSAAQLNLIYTNMPTITSSQFTVYVRSYINSTIGDEGATGGWQTKSATGNIAASVKPSISSFAVSVNSNGLDGLFVQGKSTAKLTCTATMGNGATVSSYSFSGPDLSISSTSNSVTSGTILSSGALTYKVIVTDSRGRTASAEKQIEVYPYAKPSFKSSMVNRSNASGVLDGAGTYAKYTIEGTYSSVGGKNTRTITAAYSSDNGSTYSAETTIQATTDLNATITGVYGSGALSATKSYIIRFTIKDRYGTTDTSILTLSTVSRAINIKPDNTGIAFGKIAEGSGIETPWNMSFMGSGQKGLIFEKGSSSAWKTQLRQGDANSSVVLEAWDATNSRSIWSYTKDGMFNINRPVVFSGGASGGSSVLWTGAVQNGTTVTLNESIRNFKFLTCLLGDSAAPWGITLSAFMDDTVSELHFSAVFTGNDSIAGSNFYGAKFTINSNTSLTLQVCGTKNGAGASHLRKIVGWR
jgi:hypothetical protein